MYNEGIFCLFLFPLCRASLSDIVLEVINETVDVEDTF